MDARNRRRLVPLAAALLAYADRGPGGSSCASEIASVPYHVTDLGRFVGKQLNNRGQVIGWAPSSNNRGPYAAIYNGYGTNAGVVEAPLGPDSVNTMGVALNDRGQAVIRNDDSRGGVDARLGTAGTVLMMGRR